MPPGLDGPVFQKQLADSWGAMHQEFGENLVTNLKSYAADFTGVVETPAGWKTPPRELLNPYRSFYLRTEHEDEQSIMLALSRMRPQRLEFKGYLLFTYGALYVYSVGAALALAAVTGLVTLKGSFSYYLADPSKMAAMYTAGRLLSVATFIACGLMLLRLGRRHIGSSEAGGLGAALFMMTPLAVVQAHVMKGHMFWSFFALWTLERSIRVLTRGKLKDYAAAGTVAGLGMAASIGAWVACLVVGVSGAMRLVGLHEPNGRPCPPWAELRGLVVAGFCAAAAFLIVNPYWLLDFRTAALELKLLGTHHGGLNLAYLGLFVTNALRCSVTDPVLTLMLGGAALALLKGRREPALLLCAVAFLLALACSVTYSNVTVTRQARYFLGWAGVGCLLAGRLLQELRALKGAAGRFGTATAAIVLAGLACQGLSYSHNFYLGESDRSNHFLSGAWIEKNIPAGETIGLLRYPQPSNSPFFRFDRYRLMFIEPRLAPTLPPEKLPRYLALTIPEHDDRVDLAPILSRYESLAVFPRVRLFPWITIDPTSTTANPLVVIYGLKGA
jgi:hypothetical protein